jgi:hypothetical protein
MSVSLSLSLSDASLLLTLAYASICQHMPACVSIRRHTLAYTYRLADASRSLSLSRSLSMQVYDLQNLSLFINGSLASTVAACGRGGGAAVEAAEVGCGSIVYPVSTDPQVRDVC